ncbi:MAG: hypothetical protein MRY63_07500 [Neomegalonema sp.]|nr:hypothetical protein [Neomegalonema sp.]
MTIVLSTYTEREFVVLDFIAPPSPLEMGLKPGSRFALSTGAQGKIALAFGKTEMREEFLDAPLPASTPKSITDNDHLRRQITQVRRRFWADAPDELFLGVNAVAVPLFGQGGRLVGALAAVSTTSALASPPPQSVIEALNANARKLSRLLGAGAS